MCVSGYPTVPKFWLLTLKFLEKQKNIVLIFQKYFLGLLKPFKHIQQIQLSTISQKKCESNKTQQNRNGECYTMLWDHHASPTFLLLSAIFCQKGNKFLFPFLESSQCGWSSAWNIIRLFRRLRSQCGQLSDHKRLEQKIWFKIIKIFLYFKFNKGRWWSKRQQGKQLMHFKSSWPREAEFFNVSAVIYRTKDFVMFVAVNNDVRNIVALQIWCLLTK